MGDVLDEDQLAAKPHGSWMNMMKMHAARSSLIASYGYKPETQDMEIEFSSGGTWRYSGVTMDMFKRFLQAPSKGKFFIAEIKGKHSEKKL